MNLIEEVANKNTYVNFNGYEVRISHSEAVRVIEQIENVEGDVNVNSVVLYIPDGANTSMPDPAALSVQEYTEARLLMLQIITLIQNNGLGQVFVEEKSVTTRSGRLVISVEVEEGALIVNFSNGEQKKLSEIVRRFDHHVEETGLQDIYDAVSLIAGV